MKEIMLNLQENQVQMYMFNIWDMLEIHVKRVGIKQSQDFSQYPQIKIESYETKI